MNKEYVAHTHTHTREYYSAIKILLFATSTDLECILLTEISQTEKDKYHMISYMWKESLKKKKRAHRYREQIGGCQAIPFGLGEWGMGKMGKSCQNVYASILL